MVLTANTLDQLYVSPGWTGRGIGARLIQLAKTRRPSGFTLFTFQSNAGARRFYERHGLAEISRGDGSGNEEGQPDLQYSWSPQPDSREKG
jgi:ribosomal protein S18 acetylase RimI-like enzyme